jgi:hypothetical protein
MQTQEEKVQIIWREPLIARALRAYFVAAKKCSGGADQPAHDCSTVEERGNKLYVVIRNGNRALAVYRLRPDGILKRLKRWPKEIE